MNARVLDRSAVYSAFVLLAVWVLVPFYLIAVSALTPQQQTLDYPKPLVPSSLTFGTVQLFLESGGVIPSVLNSVFVAVIAIVISVGLGAPAGYALARHRFRGRGTFEVVVLVAKMFPIAILAIPLSATFLQLGLYDSLVGLALVHAAIALPFVILIVGGVFVAVSRELEEAAQTLGSNRFDAFLQIAVPPALPGLLAAAIFTFVISWNEVFAASILTVRMRTFPAQVFASLSTSPLAFKFVAGLLMVLPAVIFVVLIRRYVTRLWGARG
jgi:multiple sugar transport system permease protein